MTDFLRSARYRAALVLRGEGELFRRLDELAHFQWDPPEAAMPRRRTSLAAILRYAHLRSDFYSRAWSGIDGIANTRQDDADAMLTQLPLLSKADLQRSAAALETRPRFRRVSRKTTGGSTGEPVTVVKDRSATAAERAAMWLAYGWHGIRMGDRAARFWGTATNQRRWLTTQLTDLVMNRTRFSAFAFGDEHLRAYWERCLEFRPVYFHGYVSMLHAFARFVRENRLPGDRLRLRAIIATSEVLTEEHRAEIEAVFRAPVRGEYGSGEIGSVAFECEEKRYHIMADNVAVEVVRPNGSRTDAGESGEIVVTDLVNRALPLVRYRIGDNGVLGSGCACGRTLPVLERIWGRAYDFVQTPEGKRFHGEFFMYFFEDLRKQSVPVRQFQVTQSSTTDLEVSVISDAPVELLNRVIGQGLARSLVGMEVRVLQVSEVARSPSGKMQVIRNVLRDGHASATTEAAR